MSGSPTSAEVLRVASRAKAQAVIKRWGDFSGRNLLGVATFQTRHGQAQIGALVHRSDENGLDSVEVWLGPQQGPPAFRIVNPPILVPDAAGDVIITERDPIRQRDVIRRYRLDPLQCIAEVVASGGRNEGS